jgi:hypothetical protein
LIWVINHSIYVKNMLLKCKLKENEMSKLREQMKSLLNNMTTAANTQETRSGGNFWKATVDSAGNGSAILRFLPQPDLNQLPHVTTYSYYFTHPVTGKVYSELAARTFGGREDPMAEYINWLWKNGHEDVAKEQKLKQNTSMYANCYIVRDPGNTENEGKVFILKYGTKIQDKIKAQLIPEYAEDESYNVFDLFEGKNFRMKIKNLAGYRNYDDSVFEEKITSVGKTDEETEEIFSHAVDLNAMFVDPSKNKPYDEKLKAMIQVFGADPHFNQWLQATGKTIAPSAKTKPTQQDDVPPWEDEVDVPTKASAAKTTSSGDDSIDDILAALGV